MAAAVAATRAGHQVTVFEAARALGGRARAVPVDLPDGSSLRLDNGQHILIGAYTETLALMQSVGVDPRRALLALPLTLRFPDGIGLKLPGLPAPLDAFAGIVCARGWNWRDKLSLLRCSAGWQRARFECADDASVADLCRPLTKTVRDELIEPLCVSALNTPIERASGQVFLRVLRDSLFGKGFGDWAGSNLLLPRIDLSACFPDAAAEWLVERGGVVRTGCRVGRLTRSSTSWLVNGESFDSVLLATAPWDAARLVDAAGLAGEPSAAEWLRRTQALRFEAIATIYVQAASTLRLSEPMLSLKSGASDPAQFVFDRGQLDGPAGLLAFVVSASTLGHTLLEAAVLAQARSQLGCESLTVLRTVVEKRATFACTPGLARPAPTIAAALLACGDYVDGPYPATIEGAVRSALSAIGMLQTSSREAP